MPAGVPVGTLAIGRAGATNAALLAASVLALSDRRLADRLDAWRAKQSASVGHSPTDAAEPSAAGRNGGPDRAVAAAPARR